MRLGLLGCSLLAVLLLVSCGSGEKPEFVEIPSGDPMPPAGEGTPIQDAPEEAEGCDAPPPQDQLSPYLFDNGDEEKNEQPQFDWVPLHEADAGDKPDFAPTVALLALPLGLAVTLRRRR